MCEVRLALVGQGYHALHAVALHMLIQITATESGFRNVTPGCSKWVSSQQINQVTANRTDCNKVKPGASKLIYLQALTICKELNSLPALARHQQLAQSSLPVLPQSPGVLATQLQGALICSTGSTTELQLSSHGLNRYHNTSAQLTVNTDGDGVHSRPTSATLVVSSC